MRPMATRSDHPAWRRLGSLARLFAGPTRPVELDRQLASVREAAERLDAERMAADARDFVAALHAGFIVAGDF